MESPQLTEKAQLASEYICFCLHPTCVDLPQLSPLCRIASISLGQAAHPHP